LGKEHCDDHTNHYNLITRNKEDIVDLWKAINGIRSWVIGGMTSLVIGVILVVAKTYIG